MIEHRCLAEIQEDEAIRIQRASRIARLDEFTEVLPPEQIRAIGEQRRITWPDVEAMLEAQKVLNELENHDE